MESSSEHKDPMAAAARFINAGQMDRAEQLCRQVIEEEPDNINVLGLLGAILLKLQKIDEAEKYLLRTIEAAPTFAKPHEDLGMLYLSQDQAERASEFFEKSVKLDPTLASAYFGLANALLKIGRPKEAESAHSKYLELSPGARALAEAAKQIDKGQSRRAGEICDEVLKHDPENVEALRLLARIATDDQQHVIAEGLLRKIVQMSPTQSAPRMDLGRFLIERGRIPEAVDMFRKSVQLDPSSANAHLSLADALSILGRSADALTSYEKCLAISPEEPSALLGRGHLLRIRGHRDEAIVSYRKCVELRPEFGGAYWSLASLKGFEFSDTQIDEMRSKVESGGLDPESEISIRFALARAFESKGDFDEAWQQYETGNGQMRSRVKYDPVKTETTHDRAIEVFSADFLNRMSSDQAVSPCPIFILGVPRSGSTLIEQILASHSMVEGAGELPHIIMISASLGKNRSDDLAYPHVLTEMSEEQLAAIGKSYIYHTGPHRQEDTPFFTDKMPANFSHAGFIHMTLPNAKIIDARRDAIDTCVGNYRQLFAQGKNQSYDLQELGEYFLQYRRMMDHWDKVLPGRILKVQYEDVVGDLEQQVRRILEYCELPWEDACMNYFDSDRAVNTASSEQVREPIYTDAIGYWKNYESHLDELLEVLAPVLPAGA
jgi:tetratricopeptide (TPR) repeat protein